MSVADPGYVAGAEPQGGIEAGGAPEAPGTPGIPGAPGVPGVRPAGGERTSGGSAAEQGLIPVATAPKGVATVIQESPVQLRYILRGFEGLNQKQSPLEMGELQAVELKNLLTDESSLKKRGGSTDVTSSGTQAVLGLHETSGLRTLTLQTCDDSTQWVQSDAVNFTRATDTTNKVEGTASLQMTALGTAAEGDAITHDLGAGSTKDLSKFDAVEVVIRGTLGPAEIHFGISEDDITYTTVIYNDPALAVTDTWQILRLDVSGMAASARDAIRFLRFQYFAGGDNTTRTIRADTIRAIKKVQHFLRAIRTAGATASGGVRSAPADLASELQSNLTGAWAGLQSHPALPANNKMRAVDWLGNTYVAFGDAGMAKFTNGALAQWVDPPPAQFIEMHYEKLWIFGVRHDPHALRHTNGNSDSVWPTDANPTGSNGGLIYVGRGYPYMPTGMKSTFGQLFLWTEGDLWILFGTDNATFSMSRAHPGAGTLSMESVAKFDTGLLWHDGVRDRILQWSGGGVVDISDPIKAILEAIPADLKPWTAGVFTGRYYLFSYAIAGGTVNTRTVLYDLLLRRWFGPCQGEWVGFNAATAGADGSVYVGLSSTTAGGVRKVLTGLTDNAAAIAMTYKSGNIFGRLPRWTKRIRRAWVRTRNTSGALTLNFYTNLSGTAVRSYVLSPTGAALEVVSTGVHDDVRGEIVQAEITESSTGALDIQEIGFDVNLIRAGR